jgi:peroxiredoxin
MPKRAPAPPISAVQWFNTSDALTLADLRGRVIVIEAFQMLCEGCVTHSLPQAQRVFETFSQDDVAVIGLHCVFENASAQTAAELEQFLREHRLLFPVAVDEPGGKLSLPKTMERYQMQGTPTTVLIDRQGHRRAQHFGPVDDLRLGAEIGTLMSERDDDDSR